jgi:ABC-2 type transport system ATP-binding protein
LANRFAGHKTVVVTLQELVDLSSFGEVIDTNGGRITLRVAREATPAVTTRLLSEHDVLDLTVEDPPIDDVIELAFASATVTAADGDR